MAGAASLSVARPSVNGSPADEGHGLHLERAPSASNKLTFIKTNNASSTLGAVTVSRELVAL